MRCLRCNGLMTTTRFYDLQDDTGHIAFDAWRCIGCGEVLDSVIYTNRIERPRFTRLPRRRPVMA